MTTTAAETGHAKRFSGAGWNKFLTFVLAGESYGIGILKLREIIGIMAITPVPHAPESVLGVINLRGKIIPVVDLRLRFGLEAAPFSERTCIIVADLGNGDARSLVGAVVDEVSEVSQIADEDIEPSPELSGNSSSDFIQGMAKLRDRVVTLLDVDKVLGRGLGGRPRAA
jgi:purine-binding chemotaxis protein CheW